MIEPSELRVGNYITSIEGGDYERYPALLEVVAILPTTWGVHCRYCSDVTYAFDNQEPYHAKEYNDVHPIQLTDKWLERLGFEKISEDSKWFLNGFSIDRCEVLLFEVCEHLASRDVELKSVHQLQNLYYSLTGEELAQI